jgi:hypothetical protein
VTAILLLIVGMMALVVLLLIALTLCVRDLAELVRFLVLGSGGPE